MRVSEEVRALLDARLQEDDEDSDGAILWAQARRTVSRAMIRELVVCRRAQADIEQARNEYYASGAGNLLDPERAARTRRGPEVEVRR